MNSCLTPKRGVIDNSTHSNGPSNKCLDTLIEDAEALQAFSLTTTAPHQDRKQ